MKTGFFGYNFGFGTASFEKFLLDAANSGCDTHLVMTVPQGGIPSSGDFNLIWDVYNYLYPIYGDDTTIIWRIYSNREGNWSTYPDSKIYQAIFASYDLPPNTIIDSFVNEPSLGGNLQIANEQYARHELQYLRDMKAIGIKYAVGAFSVGTPHEQQILNGVYDDLIKEAEYFSMHLYGQFPFEAGEIYSFDIVLKTEENRNLIRDIYFNNKKWDDGEYLGYYVRRISFWEKRAKELNVDMPDILVTEGVFDQLDYGSKQWVKDNWKQQFGLNIYNRDPRGILTWISHIMWVFNDIPFNEALKLILTHFRKNVVFQKYVKKVMLFGYNTLWDTPQGHNWENNALSSFRQNNLKEVNMSVNETVPDNDEPIKYDVIWSTSISTVRTQPNLSPEYDTQDPITTQKIPVTILDENVSGDGNGYTWIKFLRHSDNEVYYVAKTNRINYINVENDNDDVVIIDSPDGIIFTKEEHFEVVELLDSVYALIEEVFLDDVDDITYMQNTFIDFLNVIKESKDVNKEKSLLLLERMVDKIRDV